MTHRSHRLRSLFAVFAVSVASPSQGQTHPHPFQPKKWDPKENSSVECAVDAVWEDFVPNVGHVSIRESDLGRTVFMDFGWRTDADLSWYKSQPGFPQDKEYYTLETETHINGYTQGAASLLALSESDSAKYDYYSLMPCPYLDTPLFDSVTGGSTDHNIAGGTACARHLQPSQLYYTYIKLKDGSPGEVGHFERLRFQRGRWAPDWHEATLVGYLQALMCESQASSADSNQSNYGSAALCIFACHEHTIDGKNSLSYDPVTYDEINSRPGDWPLGDKLPLCAAFEFENDQTRVVEPCTEKQCDDERDNDIDGMEDCDDPDCTEHCQSSCLSGDAPDPWLPFPGGTNMGTTRVPGCGHTGSYYNAYDFNVSGETYETDNDLVTVASSSGVVTKVVSNVVGNCYTKQSCAGPVYNNGWGNCVWVKLDTCDDVYERYCHLDSGPNSIFVSEGDYVCHGTPLGRIGNTGYSSGAHLHWQREDAYGQSIPINRFVEAKVPTNTCVWCNISSHYSAGCYRSENYPDQDQCSGGLADPCEGLPDGAYCGSSGDLVDYGGNNADLVVCADGELVSMTHCTYGCNTLPGPYDECFANPPDAQCGNGFIEPGEECDSGGFAGETCETLGYDGGSLVCTAECIINEGACCLDECAANSSSCVNGQESNCEASPTGCYAWGPQTPCAFGCNGNACLDPGCGDGAVDPGEECDSFNLNGENCVSLGYDGGTLLCDNCSFSMGACCSHTHTIENAANPNYTPDAEGCALDNGVKLKLSATKISDSTIRFYVKKTDNGVWGQPATLTLYVGTGPTCGDPINVDKETVAVVLNTTTQVIDLQVDPYDDTWYNDEEKQFWVGKSESGFDSARASGTIAITRECL